MNDGERKEMGQQTPHSLSEIRARLNSRDYFEVLASVLDDIRLDAGINLVKDMPGINECDKYIDI